MTDFPTTNETRATATNLGFISRYSTIGTSFVSRTDSINTPPTTSTDKYDYFTFRHTKGLTKVSITLTILESPYAQYSQGLNLDLGDGFGVVVNGVVQGSDSNPPLPTGVALIDWVGDRYDSNFNPSSTFNVTTKTFTFNVKPNTTVSSFVVTGIHQYASGPFDYQNELVDLNYSFSIRVFRETDLRNKIVGTNSNDTLHGRNSDDLILGRAGNDTERGNGGNDELRGDSGSDTLYGDNGHDKIIGGSGNDKILGGNHNDTLLGNIGNDLIRGGSGNDRAFGHQGADRIFGDAGNDVIRGGPGNDYLRGGAGNDVIYGEQGTDRIFGDGGNDKLFGGSENDTIYGGTGIDFIAGDAGNDRLFGDAQNDIINGGVGNDLIVGGDGDDQIFGDSGINQLFGGLGADQFYLAAPGDGIQYLRDFYTNTDLGQDKIVIDLDLYPTLTNNTGGFASVIRGQNFHYGVGADPNVYANNVLYTYNYNSVADTVDLFFKDDTGTSILVAVVSGGVSEDDFLLIA